MLRDLLDEGLAATRAKKGHQTAGQALLGLVALGKKYGAHGPGDLSTNLDDYLYGDKK